MYFESIKDMANGEPLTLTIKGECMAGTLPDGGRVQVEKRDLYWPGDVIVYARLDDTMVSHRLLGYAHRGRGWLAITRADQSEVADRPFSTSRILGKVIRTDGKTISVSTRQRALAVSGYWQFLTGWFRRKLSKVFAFSIPNR